MSALPKTAESFKDATWQDILPYYQELAERPLDRSNVEAWLADWSLFESMLAILATVAARTIRPIYVSVWFFIASPIWLAVDYAIGNVIWRPGHILGAPSGALDNSLADVLIYKSDTAPGSSGAPVFNNEWQVIALHSAGVPKQDAQGRYVDKDGQVRMKGHSPVQDYSQCGHVVAADGKADVQRYETL